MPRKRTAEQCAQLRAELLALLTQRHWRLKELAEHLHIGKSTLEKHLLWLREQRMIDHYRVVNDVRWALKSTADALNAEAARRQAARTAQADAEREAARARRAEAEARLDAEIEREMANGAPDLQPVRRIVPAHSVRAKVTGPRSVFDLGDA